MLDAPTTKAVVIANIRVRILISSLEQLTGNRLFVIDDLSYRVHGFANAAPNVAFGVFGFALAFEMAVSDNLASLLLIVPVAFFTPPSMRCRPSYFSI